MKKLVISILILIFALAFLGCQKKPAVDTTEETTKEETVDATEEKPVDEEKMTLKKIGPDDELLIYWFNAPPFNIADEEGKLPVGGLAYDISVRILKEIGQTKYKWVMIQDANKDLQDVKAGEGHYINTLFRSFDQEKMFTFTTDFGYASQAIYVHNDGPDSIGGKTEEELFKSLKGLHIGTIKAITEVLDQKIPERDYKSTIVEHEANVLRRLSKKEFDAAAVPYESLLYLLNDEKLPLRVAGIFNRSPYGAGFTKTIDPEIITRWNKAWEDLKKKGELKKIFDKYDIAFEE